MSACDDDTAGSQSELDEGKIPLFKNNFNFPNSEDYKDDKTLEKQRIILQKRMNVIEEHFSTCKNKLYQVKQRKHDKRL